MKRDKNNRGYINTDRRYRSNNSGLLLRFMVVSGIAASLIFIGIVFYYATISRTMDRYDLYLFGVYGMLGGVIAGLLFLLSRYDIASLESISEDQDDNFLEDSPTINPANGNIMSGMTDISGNLWGVDRKENDDDL